MDAQALPTAADQGEPSSRVDPARPFREHPRRLRPAEAAQLARVSTRTIFRWIGAGLLRAVRPTAGVLLIDRDSLATLLGESVS